MIEFIVLPHDESWKIYREGELVAVYPSHAAAAAHAACFTDAITQNGRVAKWRTLGPAEVSQYVQAVVEFYPMGD